MKNEDSKRNIILTSIVLPLVVGILVEIFTSIEVFNFIISAFKYLGSFFIASFSISVWLFLLIVFISLGIGAGFVILMSKAPEKEPYENYVRDRIFGINWQWDWYMGDVISLIPLCPECSYQPEIESEYVPGPYSDKAKIECENCEFRKKWDMHPSKLEERVTKEIHRRLRTGEYEEKILSVT